MLFLLWRTGGWDGPIPICGGAACLDWYLEDIEGGLHKALFIYIKKKSDVVGMSWDRRIQWSRELQYAKNDGRHVYKLIDAFKGVPQGGISLRDAADHVHVELIESASHNREGSRHFVNVSRLLIAFAGQRSVEIGAEGFLVLKPKTALYEYYKNRFGAFPLPGGRVGIPDYVTKYWISVYYK